MSSFICSHHQLDCPSCPLMFLDYSEQVAKKEQALRQLLTPFLASCQWLSPCLSPVQRCRNKAKMVVSGSVERPILGILPDPFHPQTAVDLCDCPLYPESFQGYFAILKDFIARAGLVPFNVAKNKGELKYILLTESHHTQQLMLRFVLRTEANRSLIERELAGLMQKIPHLAVVSLNIQPKNAAILEGEKEIFLTEEHFLAENFNQVPLFIRPQGFFQTNPSVAKKLYATASQWAIASIQKEKHQQIWDLFCGSGGFGLHIAHALKETPYHLVGIEISPSAIECAKRSGETLGLKALAFQALNVDQFDTDSNTPDLVVVNPPRRGVGEKVTAFLEKLQPNIILYSSCNAETMAKDLIHLPHYQLKKIQLFDMFPHTNHYEVLALLQKIKG